MKKLFNLKKILFNLKKKNFDIFYLSSSLTTIASFDLMFLSKFNSFDLNFSNNINYYIGLNQVNFKSNNIKEVTTIFKNNFNIYQNSFFDNNFKFCNIMLPVYNCFELENQYFINSMGLVKQNMKVEVNLEEFLKSNIDSLKFIFKIINFKLNNELNIKLVDNLLYYFFFKIRNIVKFNLFNKLNFNEYVISIKYKNFYLVSFNKNFYKSNIYCFYSKQLNMMSNLFFKEKSNFDL